MTPTPNPPLQSPPRQFRSSILPIYLQLGGEISGDITVFGEFTVCSALLGASSHVWVLLGGSLSLPPPSLLPSLLLFFFFNS